jgi:hypothetical protein
MRKLIRALSLLAVLLVASAFGLPILGLACRTAWILFSLGFGILN